MYVLYKAKKGTRLVGVESLRSKILLCILKTQNIK